MTDIITAILSVIEIIPAFVKMINKQAANTKGLERGLILEMKANAELIQVHRTDEVTADEVIKHFEIDKLEKALDSDFKFTSIKRGKVKARIHCRDRLLRKIHRLDNRRTLRKFVPKNQGAQKVSGNDA